MMLRAREGFGSLHISRLIKVPKSTVDSWIYHGNHPTKYKKWTNEEIELLKRIFSKSPLVEITSKLGRTWNSIQHKAYQLGLRRDSAVIYADTFDSPITKEVVTPFDLGFLIGMIEGEGCIGAVLAKRKNRPNPRIIPIISIVNSDIELLKKTQQIIGGKIYRHNWGRQGKPTYVLRLTHVIPVLKTLTKIKPYLVSNRKSKVADLVIELCRIRLNNPRQPPTQKEFEILEAVRRCNGRAPIQLSDPRLEQKFPRV